MTIASTDVGGTGLSTVGTNGQVLTSNGTTLSWQTPAAATTFSAGTTGFTPTERMRLDSSGNLGIGTTAPQQKLGIKPASNIPQLYLIQDNVANDGYKLFADSSSGYLGFIRTASGSDTERMRISIAGNLQISSGLPILNSSGRPMVNQTGGILQVVQTIKTDYSAGLSGTTFTNIPAQGGSGSFTLSITPSSTSSKILLNLVLNGGISSAANCYFRITRNGTPIGVGDAANSNLQAGTASFYNGAGGSHDTNYMFTVSQVFLDSPATTSAISYQVQVWVQSGASITIGISASQGSGSALAVVPACTMIAQEIAG